MDWSPLIENYGLPGIVIAGMGLAILTLYRRNTALQDARVEDLREQTKQMLEMSRSLDRAVQAIQEVRR
jgi:predicted membrane chloride channel (bestrophin family)